MSKSHRQYLRRRNQHDKRREKYLHTPCGKRPFRNQEAAERGIERARVRFGRALEAYQCRECGKFHLATRRGQKVNQQPESRRGEHE